MMTPHAIVERVKGIMRGKVLRGLVLAAAVPPACAPVPPPAAAGVVLAPGIVLTLPAPADLGRPVEAAQMVTAKRGGDIHVFETRLSITPERLVLAATDPLGRRAMTVHWRAGTVTADKAEWVPDGLRPENVLADMIVLYWPEAVLRRAVRGAAVTADGNGRAIGDAIRVRWDGDPWNGRARLVNAWFGYELDIRSTTVAP